MRPLGKRARRRLAEHKAVRRATRVKAGGMWVEILPADHRSGSIRIVGLESHGDMLRVKVARW